MTAYNVISRTAMVEDQPEDISVILANFDAIAAVINGSIDESNFASGKLYSLAKIKQGAATTGQYMQWNGTDWVPASLPTVTMGTAFPGSPANGDEHVLIDSNDVPTYSWRFKYNADVDDAYKWLCIGGAPKIVENAGSVSSASGSYVDLFGLTQTLPRAGYWQIMVSGFFVADNTQGFGGYQIDGVQGADDQWAWGTGTSGGGFGRSGGSATREWLLASGNVIRAMHRSRSDGVVTTTFYRPRLSIMPRRLS